MDPQLGQRDGFDTWKSFGNWKYSVNSHKNGIDILGTVRSYTRFVKVSLKREVENFEVMVSGQTSVL